MKRRKQQPRTVSTSSKAYDGIIQVEAYDWEAHEEDEAASRLFVGDDEFDRVLNKQEEWAIAGLVMLGIPLSEDEIKTHTILIMRDNEPASPAWLFAATIWHIRMVRNAVRIQDAERAAVLAFKVARLIATYELLSNETEILVGHRQIAVGHKGGRPQFDKDDASHRGQQLKRTNPRLSNIAIARRLEEEGYGKTHTLRKLNFDN